MQCRTCGFQLPTGAVNCPNCGSATPYNASAGSYDPTQRAGQVPPTSYGTPPPPPSMPGVDPSYPYGSTPYDRTTASSPYGATYPTPQTPTPQMQGYPQQYNNVPSTPQLQGYPQQQQYNTAPPVPNYPQVPQTPRKNNSTIIIAAVGVVLVLVIIFGVVIASHLGQSNQGTNGTQTAIANNPTATPTQAPTPTPAGEQVDPAAAKIIVNARTASAYDKQNYTPTKLATTFKDGDTVYISYELNLADVTPKNGVYGNVYVKFINDGILYQTGTLNNVDEDHINSVTQGTIPAYFYLDNYPATTNGVIKLYWCDTNDCANPRLAQAKTFTVS